MGFSAVDMPSQEGKVAIVTGGNSGIGFETVLGLAKKGAHVVMASRNTEKAAAARAEILGRSPRALVDVIKLDLGDLASVRNFVTEFRQKHSRLDLLVNNAGIMLPPFGKTPDGFELTFATNYLGPFLLTGLLLPLLLAAPDSRVVTVSSLAHTQGKIARDNLNGERAYSKMAAYGQSKLANLLFAFELERQLNQREAKTISVAAHPGWTVTNLQVNSKIFTFLNPFFGQDSSSGALPSLFAAAASGVRGGDYYGPQGFLELKGAPKKVKANASAHDLETAKWLWATSEKMVGHRYFT